MNGHPTIEILRGPITAPRIAPQSDATQASSGVLLLVDDPALRSAMRMLLRLEGYRVFATAALPEALDLARRERSIDTVIMSDPLAHGVAVPQALASLRQVIGANANALVITREPPSRRAALQDIRSLRVATIPISSDMLLATLRSLGCRGAARRE